MELKLHYQKKNGIMCVQYMKTHIDDPLLVAIADITISVAQALNQTMVKIGYLGDYMVCMVLQLI